MNSEFFTKNKIPIALIVGALITAGAIYFSGNSSQSPSVIPSQNIDKSQLPAQLPSAINESVQLPSIINQSGNSDTNTNCLIKGNISASGEKIYHLPGCGSYKKTVITESKGERWFCSEKEAISAGWRKAKNCP